MAAPAGIEPATHGLGNLLYPLVMGQFTHYYITVKNSTTIIGAQLRRDLGCGLTPVSCSVHCSPHADNFAQIAHRVIGLVQPETEFCHNDKQPRSSASLCTPDIMASRSTSTPLGPAAAQFFSQVLIQPQECSQVLPYCTGGIHHLRVLSMRNRRERLVKVRDEENWTSPEWIPLLQTTDLPRCGAADLLELVG